MSFHALHHSSKGAPSLREFTMQTLLPLEGQAEDALDDKIGRIWGMNSNHIVLKMAAVKVNSASWR